MTVAASSATDEYKANSDKIGNFIAECLEESTENSTIKEVYEKYILWCRDNGFGAENKSNFSAELNGKGLIGAGKVNGMTYKKVIKGYAISTDFVPLPDDKGTPFCGQAE